MLEENLLALNAALLEAEHKLHPRMLNEMLRKVAQKIRKNNQKRMRAQKSPRGVLWEERKNQEEKRPMMERLRTTKFYKIKRVAEEYRLGFTETKIAAAHHFGKTEELEYGVAVYPVRELHGINDEDFLAVKKIVMLYLREAGI